MEWSSPPGQPLLQVDVAPIAGAFPLRCCLLSGGASRRMGRDKALLPHPEGGTWLERTLRVLALLGVPLTVLSRWPRHLELAAAMTAELAAVGVLLEVLAEAEPSEGPLRALGRLMDHHPDQRLLLCPVDMPALDGASLRALAAVVSDPPAIVIATAERPQPLLGIYPSDPGHRQRLQGALAAGERSLLRWLAAEPLQQLALAERALANVNTAADLQRLESLMTTL